jgi:hypothetical protein
VPAAESALRQPKGPINETADDAVVLRVIAGLVRMLMLLGYLAVRRHATFPPMLPAGLVDALGAAAAFAAGTAGLAIASADQAARNGTSGVAFPLSGALLALPATVYFCPHRSRPAALPLTLHRHVMQLAAVAMPISTYLFIRAARLGGRARP